MRDIVRVKTCCSEKLRSMSAGICKLYSSTIIDNKCMQISHLFTAKKWTKSFLLQKHSSYKNNVYSAYSERLDFGIGTQRHKRGRHEPQKGGDNVWIMYNNIGNKTLVP